jgi:hypothetical protein
MLLPLLILACLGYFVFAVSVIVSERRGGDFRELGTLHPAIKFVFAGGVPLAVAATMTYLFLIVGGSTTAQLNVGQSSALHVWTLWVDLWRLFLFLSAASGLGALIWLVVCALNKAKRKSIPAAVASLILSVLAFFTVVSYFPSA